MTTSTEELARRLQISRQGLRPMRPLAKHQEENRHYQGVPTIAVTSGGILYVSIFTGGRDEGPENFCVLYRSDDGGASWQGPIWVVDTLKSDTRVLDPVLWTDPEGRLWWFWTKDYCDSYEHANFDARRGGWGCCCANPEAAPAEMQWSDPVFLCEGTLSSTPIVQSDGSWAFLSYVPYELREWSDDPVCRELSGINLYRSTDCFRSAQHISHFGLAWRNFADECDLVETSPGHLWAFIRTDYGIGESFSSDNGLSWSEVAPNGLRAAPSRITLDRLPNGEFMTIYNELPPVGEFKTDAVRKCITAAFTRDEGRSWYKRVLIDERADTSYPKTAICADGTFWMVYDFNRYGGGCIHAVHLTQEGAILRRSLVSRVQPFSAVSPRPEIPVTPVPAEARPVVLRRSNDTPSEIPTSVTFQYDAQNLLITAECGEPGGEALYEDAEVYKSDCIDVYLAPLPDRPEFFIQLLGDAFGRRALSIVRSGLSYVSYPAAFTTRVRREEKKWTITFTVPWAVLFCPEPPETMRGNVFRRRPGKRQAPQDAFQAFSPCGALCGNRKTFASVRLFPEE